MPPFRRPLCRVLAGGMLALLLPATVLGCGNVSPGQPSTGARSAPVPAPSGTPTPAPTRSTPVPTASVTPTPTSNRSTPVPTASGTSARPSDSVGTPCIKLAASLSLTQQVGQLFMVGVDTGTGLGPGQPAAMADAHVGSTILLGNTTVGVAGVRRLTSAVRDAMRAPAGVAPLLAADQEGGQVQRLQGDGFDRIPSAIEQAEQSGSSLRRNAERWGRQLKLAGIDANLAPVADVVPSRLEQVNQPIGVLRRGYGPDVGIVAEKVAAFTVGMGEAGILTSVKHFPGLGKVRGNTDFQTRVVDSSTSRTDHDLAGFGAAVESSTDMVMMSSAYYALIDRESPAAFSTTVVQGMLRGDLGFTGVVISDDLAAKAVQYLAPGERAVRFLSAGGDLMIVGDPSLLADMASAVRKQARSDPAFADQLTRHAARVLQMKARRGLADCR